MSTIDQWRDAAAALKPTGYGAPGTGELADRLHLLAGQDGRAGLRRILEHLRFHAVPEEDWDRFVALHSFADGRNPSVVAGVAKSWVEDRDLTELGLARRIADQHGADLAWCKTLGGWATWDGARWKSGDGDHHAQGYAVRTVDALGREVALAEAKLKVAAEEEAVATESEKEAAHAKVKAAEGHAKAVRAFARDAQKARTIANALTLARSEGLAVDADQFDARPELLTVANGTVELGEVAELREHRRADRLTRAATASCDREAASAEWDAFVAHVIPDPDARHYAHKLAGYSLYGANDKRMLVFLLGPTSSGKSTFVETIGAVLGDHAADFKLSLFTSKQTDAPRPDLIDALPKRFLHASETSDRWRLHADEIKTLTGNDTQRARAMRSDHYLARKPAFTPWVATNNPPTIEGADQGLWRRLVVIPCGETIERSKEDTGLAARFTAEQRDAVLAWLLDGWELYQAEGVDDMPNVVVKAGMKLRDSLSVVDVWLSEETEQDAEYSATADDLWAAFSAWCSVSGVTESDRGNKIGFGMKLGHRGFGTGHVGPKDKRQRVRLGLRVRADARSLTGGD